jgi:hypothetical protein
MAQDKAGVTYNPDPPQGSAMMDITPLDPRQGQVTDATVPHATDTVLPDVRPTVQQPTIDPLSPAYTTQPTLIPRVSPGQYKTGSKGVTKT